MRVKRMAQLNISSNIERQCGISLTRERFHIRYDMHDYEWSFYSIQSKRNCINKYCIHELLNEAVGCQISLNLTFYDFHLGGLRYFSLKCDIIIIIIIFIPSVNIIPREFKN